MTSIYDWSLNAPANANADALIDWAEGQPPSSVNNSARAMMQRIREYIADTSGEVTVSGAANNINVLGKIPLTKYQNGVRLRFTATQTNTKKTVLNYNNVGEKTIFKTAYSGICALSGGEIVAGGIYDVVYRAELANSAGGWLLLNPTVSKLYQTGMIAAFAMPVAPAGWLECDGRSLDRKEYEDLFKAIGTIWGEGAGKNSFSLPDLRGQFVRGWDHGRGKDEDKARPFASAQETANMHHTHIGTCEAAGQHSHNFSHVDIFDGNGGVRWGDNRRTQDTHCATSSDGLHSHKVTISGTGGMESRPVNVALLYAIKI